MTEFQPYSPRLAEQVTNSRPPHIRCDHHMNVTVHLPLLLSAKVNFIFLMPLQGILMFINNFFTQSSARRASQHATFPGVGTVLGGCRGVHFHHLGRGGGRVMECCRLCVMREKKSMYNY